MWNWRSPSVAEVAERIDRELPRVRLIAQLRNPVDRFYSAFIHHMLHDRIARDEDLLECARRSAREKRSRVRLVVGGLYGLGLAPFVERFGDRLLVLVHEDAYRDPRATYARALEHVGADPSFVSPYLTRVVNSYRPPTDSPYADGSGGRRPLTPEERAELFSYFREDVERLEALLGRDFSLWRPS